MSSICMKSSEEERLLWAGNGVYEWWIIFAKEKQAKNSSSINIQTSLFAWLCVVLFFSGRGLLIVLSWVRDLKASFTSYFSSSRLFLLKIIKVLWSSAGYSSSHSIVSTIRRIWWIDTEQLIVLEAVLSIVWKFERISQLSHVYYWAAVRHISHCDVIKICGIHGRNGKRTWSLSRFSEPEKCSHDHRRDFSYYVFFNQSGNYERMKYIFFRLQSKSSDMEGARECMKRKLKGFK